MSLLVDKIKCVEESDEIGSDDIYLIAFRGRTLAPFASALSAVGPGAAWSDFDTGETHNADVQIGGTMADGVYAVMMVEKDSGKDITGSEVLGMWQAQTDLIWKSLMFGVLATGSSPGSEQSKAAAFTGISHALNGLASLYMDFPKGDDDVIAVHRVTITKPGQTQTIRFRSNAEDATYDVTFKHTGS